MISTDAIGKAGEDECSLVGAEGVKEWIADTGTENHLIGRSRIDESKNEISLTNKPMKLAIANGIITVSEKIQKRIGVTAVFRVSVASTFVPLDAAAGMGVVGHPGTGGLAGITASALASGRFCRAVGCWVASGCRGGVGVVSGWCRMTVSGCQATPQASWPCTCSCYKLQVHVTS